MKISYLTRSSLVIVLGLSGCIDEISGDLPAPPTRVVVNSLLTPDSVFQVQVSRVGGMTDTASRLLDQARVTLLTPGAASPELLQSASPGFYRSARSPVSGQPYTLAVDVPGYPSVEATDTIPVVVPVQEAWYAYPTGTDRNNEVLGTIVVRFTDPAPATNFYEISCYQGVRAQTAFRNGGIPLDARGNAAVTAEDDQDTDPPSLVFSDRLFNGRSFELRAAFLPNARSGGGIINGQPVPPSIGGNLYVVVRSISRAYYQYRKSWTRHLYNQGTKGQGQLYQLVFLGDPTAMYTNVDGGYGVVAGYAQQTLILRPR